MSLSSSHPTFSHPTSSPPLPPPLSPPLHPLLILLLSRNPSIPDDLSQYAASCIKFTRQLSSQMVQEAEPSANSHTHHHTHSPLTLSPPGSSELALRRTLSPPTSHSNHRTHTDTQRTWLVVYIYYVYHMLLLGQYQRLELVILVMVDVNTRMHDERW